MSLLSQCFPSCTTSEWRFISHLSSRPLEAGVPVMAQCFLTWFKFISVTLLCCPGHMGLMGSDGETLGGGTVEGRFVPLLRIGKKVGLLNLT